MDLSNVKAGDTLYRVSRANVRAGLGPKKIVVLSPVSAKVGGEPCVIGVNTATRGYASRYDLYSTLAAAQEAGRDIARRESRDELRKYNKIVDRLKKSYKACGGELP